MRPMRTLRITYTTKITIIMVMAIPTGILMVTLMR
jgi:hypothetical protein